MMLSETLIKQIAPFDCLFCGEEGRILCERCSSKITHNGISRCYRCRKATQDAATCPACRRRTALKHVWVATELKDASKRLLYAFKFERAQAAATHIAALMCGVLPRLRGEVIVVSVPTATSRMRQRGYDHAALLAREIAAQSGLTYRQPLVRLTQTRQVGSTGTARRNQLRDAFRVRRREAVSGMHVLLVDDVLTTGATIEEVAQTMRTAGAASVSAVVFAQKIASVR